MHNKLIKILTQGRKKSSNWFIFKNDRLGGKTGAFYKAVEKKVM